MTTTPTSGAAELLALIDAYAEARHVQGHSSYNDHTKAARKAVVAALASAPAQAAEPAPPQEAQEPDFWTVCAQYEDGDETEWIPLPGYSNETEHGVKNLVLQAARKEGYKGTVTGRMMELNWEIRPVYLAPWVAPQPSPTTHPADSVLEDAARLDFLIDQGAYVVSDPDTCTGYWLHWARPDGDTWVQIDKYPTPRAAIDAARKQEEKQ